MITGMDLHPIIAAIRGKGDYVRVLPLLHGVCVCVGGGGGGWMIGMITTMLGIMCCPAPYCPLAEEVCKVQRQWTGFWQCYFLGSFSKIKYTLRHSPHWRYSSPYDAPLHHVSRAHKLNLLSQIPTDMGMSQKNRYQCCRVKMCLTPKP